MKARAFCPAHVTGFFKAEVDGAAVEGEGKSRLDGVGSLGAGFSIDRGVVTTVEVAGAEEKAGAEGPRRRAGGYGGRRYAITTRGFAAGDMRVSEHVLDCFLAGPAATAGGVGKNGGDIFVKVDHEISVPVGYGLGSSGAVALSLSYALDEALGTGMSREEIGWIAHAAEVSCRTGLGDVLASYHGGFEIRTRAGAPGVGEVEMIDSSGIAAVMICFAPVSTADFIRDRLPEINGLGGRMVGMLREDKSIGRFQDMSLEFARYVDVMTPRMQGVVDELAEDGIRCGVALFGETVFSLVPQKSRQMSRVLEIAQRYGDSDGAVVISSGIDQCGARPIR